MFKLYSGNECQFVLYMFKLYSGNERNIRFVHVYTHVMGVKFVLYIFKLYSGNECQFRFCACSLLIKSKLTRRERFIHTKTCL